MKVSQKLRMLPVKFLVTILISSAWPLPAQTRSDPWDPVTLGSFIDGVLEAQHQAHHFAGAVVVVVRDGRTPG